MIDTARLDRIVRAAMRGLGAAERHAIDDCLKGHKTAPWGWLIWWCHGIRFDYQEEGARLNGRS